MIFSLVIRAFEKSKKSKMGRVWSFQRVIFSWVVTAFQTAKKIRMGRVLSDPACDFFAGREGLSNSQKHVECTEFGPFQCVIFSLVVKAFKKANKIYNGSSLVQSSV